MRVNFFQGLIKNFDVCSFTKIATFSGGVMMTVYLLLYVYYLHRGFVLLRSRPYNSFRVGNVLVRLQVLHSLSFL